MNKYERLTKRVKFDGVRYEDRDDIYTTCYPDSEENDTIDELAIRLCELEDKIEQGTLIELPCKLGDTVYFIIKSGNEFVLLEDACIGFTIADGEINIGLENIPVAVTKYYFDREEAEKRLKELQK